MKTKKNTAQAAPDHRLREVRLGAGVSQKLLAELVGTTPQQIYKLEVGIVRLSKYWMDKIARALGVEPWMLIADPKTILDDHDRELLSRYRALPENLRAAVDSILFADASAPLPSPRGGEGAGRKSGG